MKESYGLDVVESVSQMAAEHIDDCVALANTILPQMATVLSMQRGKYYGFGEHGSEFPIFEQASDIDKTPVHNLEMERQCGDTDNRLKKKPNLAAAARGTILKRTTKLRKVDASSDFRKMGSIVKVIEDITSDWTKRQHDLQVTGLSMKEANALRVENRKLNILERLKIVGGPFTSAEQIDEYLSKSETAADQKQRVKIKRMRDEVTYARDTSLSLPRANVVFKIFKTESGKRKMLTAEEFGQNLKVLLGKTTDRTCISMDDFRSALHKV